jgi:hypothetical protein
MEAPHPPRNGQDETMPTEPYGCPCCGRKGLLSLPYANWPGQLPRGAEPPYEELFGRLSYEICPCCGFEFGNDDNPGTAPPITFSEYRPKWLSDGCSWFRPDERPRDWDVQVQLREAGTQSE